MRFKLFSLSAKKKKLLKEAIGILIALFALCAGAMILWVSTFELPDVNAFEQRKISESTKIYDREGKNLLYSVQENVKRTVVPSDEMSKNIKNATVAIEDAEFYEHYGIKPKSILRAIFANLKSGKFSQGGSTITQQVIKNTFLTTDKTITRKVKEWVLAIRLEKVLSKDKILETYLNEAPYGGNIYGVEEASQAYFAKPAYDLTLAEAAYLAALPQAPTYYSPYGNHKQELIDRKNLVLKKMLENNFITADEYQKASADKVDFRPREERGIKAPHFVIYVKEYLAQKYGENAMQENGYKVITTLDYGLQEKAQDLTKKFALQNKKTYNAENAGVVIIDPKTGQILSMVGSRDYFDTEIDGNFNVTLAHRQPGSTFKPIVYAEALEKGYLPETVVFDAKTQFSSNCAASNLTSAGGCYSPDNYDEKFRGPISFRNALAQSVNIASVKILYLAGIQDSLNLAKKMGVESLASAGTYGLTLVLGGGEASPLDMTSAYSVFANEGVRNPPVAILRIEDRDGKVIEEFKKQETEVLPRSIALTISDILSDNVARTPLYGANSLLYFPGKDVAVKTGTTNNYKDAWTIGYTPTVTVGAWVGNNDNRPMERKLSGQLVVPLWNAVMQEALKVTPIAHFEEPDPVDTSYYKPILKGVWQDPTGVHSILHYVDTNNPLGGEPRNPNSNPQYSHWEYGVQKWLTDNGSTFGAQGTSTGVSIPVKKIVVAIVNPQGSKQYKKGQPINIGLEFAPGGSPIVRANYYLNNAFLGSSGDSPFEFTFTPDSVKKINTLKVILTDSKDETGEAQVEFETTN
ncbi:MAG: PBP1A family penicillin-binding protein [Candidatus Taylorbacteria bacterium]